MKKWKYIVVVSGGLEVPVLFTEMQKHDDVANGRKVVSAGFVSVSIKDNTVSFKCFGCSLSLNVNARESDSNLISKFFNKMITE